MESANYLLSAAEQTEQEYDFMLNLDQAEEDLKNQIRDELDQIEFLDDERRKIENPDSLGKVALDEIWKQFCNQVGLDLTNETLIQKYDREHPETYDEVKNKVMQDPAYKEANKEMKQKQQEGTLKDEYTGKTLDQNDNANLDHTVSRKEIYENKRRRQANLSTEELANKKENLNATNESLNKSKGAKTTEEYIAQREEREKSLREQNERANKKIEESNMSDVEKKAAIEKNNKRLQDKLDADDELMAKKDKQARKAINKDIAKGVAKETGKKAGKDALKAVAVAALFDLLKEIMNGFVRFLKEKSKSFASFLEHMKQAFTNFLHKITTFLKTGLKSAIGTVVTEVFGPIVSMFKKLASLIKQGINSGIDAISYLRAEENKGKPFGEKMAQVGKIAAAAIASGGAILLGEVIEKALMSVPGMAIEIPLLGSLANIIGMFLAAVVSGLIGSIIINMIDRFLANKRKEDLVHAINEKNNEIITAEKQMIDLSNVKLATVKQRAAESFLKRHEDLEHSQNELELTAYTESRQDNEAIFRHLNEMLDSL